MSVSHSDNSVMVLTLLLIVFYGNALQVCSIVISIMDRCLTSVQPTYVGPLLRSVLESELLISLQRYWLLQRAGLSSWTSQECSLVRQLVDLLSG